jgi:hypothetical protein
MAPSPLNNKRVKIQVLEGAMKSGGVFSSSYLIYKIKTDPLNWTIHRKDSDFYDLRKIFCKNYPYLIVPPLPT